MQMEDVSLLGSICGELKKNIFLIVLHLRIRLCKISPTYVGLLKGFYYLSLVEASILLRFHGCYFSVMSLSYLKDTV